MSDITLYGTHLSGHAHRVALLLRMLGLTYDFAEAGAPVRATAEFKAMNPLGQIPVLRDGGLVLADSNAILVYLAKRYDKSGQWLPNDAAGAAAVQRWLSVAAGEVRFGPALARAVPLFGVPGDVDWAKALSARLLAFMDRHLDRRAFLAADHATIADLACYSYVAHAPEGGIDLAPYGNVRAWLGRVEALPGFQPMPTSAVPG
jgi:glutathione S-transferase